jgi:hypothetical protein
MTELLGHTSPETAYLVPDYPYGFRLRCQIRYWIETKKGHGQRVVSQTTNPKRPGEHWNQPKGSTYATIKALYLDDTSGHVENAGISGYANEEELDAFIAKFPQTCAEPRNQAACDYLRATFRVHKRITWKVSEGTEPTQTPQEQNEILRKLTAIEMRKIREERSQ